MADSKYPGWCKRSVYFDEQLTDDNYKLLYIKNKNGALNIVHVVYIKLILENYLTEIYQGIGDYQEYSIYYEDEFGRTTEVNEEKKEEIFEKSKEMMSNSGVDIIKECIDKIDQKYGNEINEYQKKIEDYKMISSPFSS